MLLQISSDFVCCFVAFYCGFSKQYSNRKFFYANSLAYFSLGVSDVYYNFVFRIFKHDISHSIDFMIVGTMVVFQLSQAYGWRYFSIREKFKFFSCQNLPYILFCAVMVVILVYYSLTSNDHSVLTTWYQNAAIALDMFVWLYAIVCLSRARSLSIILLTLGTLLLISSSMTMRSLFMLDMQKVIPSQWIHVIWTIGVMIAALGFALCLKKKKFTFCPDNSIQVNSCTWFSISAIVVLIIGFTFLLLIDVSYNDSTDIRSMLWSFPIALVFTTITSVLLGNWFSKTVVLPINHFLRRIEVFNQGRQEEKKPIDVSSVHEFKLLGNFMDDSFTKLAQALDNEVKIAAQVVHDIRSPLAALEMIIKRLPEVEESKRILLRDALVHIRDIANNLEKTASSKDDNDALRATQIAVLVDHLLSEKQVSLQNEKINFEKSFHPEAYSFFISTVPSVMRRILTNVINNSCEAINEEGGLIKLSLNKVNEDIIIKVTDTGSGIPREKIESIFIRGFTTKSSGSGLGLYHAKENILNWNGNIGVNSIPSGGTEISIVLPCEMPPPYFIGHLSFSSDEMVVCVDDSISILNVWKERFSQLKSAPSLHYCKLQKNLEDLLSHDEGNVKTFLIDYEFSGENYTGFDLVKKIISTEKNYRIYLVTSRSNEKSIQQFCVDNDISLIPKSFILEIPINVD